MKKIGVIGCGGTIGPIICSYLSSANVEIIGGQRSEPDFCKYPENFRWKHLDINDGEELSDFAANVMLYSIVQALHTFYLKKWLLLQRRQARCMSMLLMH